MHAVRKRLESNIKSRKSSRLTVFDKIRNLPRCDSPKRQPDAQSKVEHRRVQLEKWKEEKEKKKKEAAAQKKKPFIAGVPHAPMKFLPPPPPKPMPSSSGRVTRSQTVKNTKAKPTKTTPKTSKASQSFAPKNASFKPPEMKNMAKVPTLAPQTKNKKDKTQTITFEPVLPVPTKGNAKTTKSKVQPETKNNSNKVPVQKRTTRGNLVKAPSSGFQSHSSSDNPSPVREKAKTKTRGKLAKTSSSELSQSSSSNDDLPVPAKPKNKTPSKSIQRESKLVTPRNPVPKSESSSEERLRSPKSPVDMPMTPEQIVEEAKRISPCVTLSRGKANARREMKKKMDEGLLDEDATDIESVDHFRRQLNSEIKRMTEMCETWDKIFEQVPLPDTIQELVLAAVGQARLLMSQKMQQFASLLARCERPEPGTALVTPGDLHGFWDMVFMQVENVDMRFKKLEELRARGWAEDAPPAPRQRAAAAPRPPKAAAGAKPAATSRLRDMIAAARKAKKEQAVHEEVSPPTTDPPEPAKTFEAGFFCVRSPVRSPAPAPATPSRQSLLKAVLSSEAKKASASKNSASLAMLRASIIGKNVENDEPLAEPLVSLTPINLYATPGRSILKSLHSGSSKKSGKKSIKVVLFNNSDADQDTSIEQESPQDHNDVSGVEKLDTENTDSGLSSTDTEKDVGQENKASRRKSWLMRQDALDDRSPVMTRSRRKSMQSTVEDASDDVDEKAQKRTPGKKKALQEVEVNILEGKVVTPKRSSRRKSTGLSVAA